MKHLSKLVIAFGLFGYGLTIQAQNTIPATGGNATGTGGSVLLQDKKVESRETEISMDDLSSSVYFLKVIKDNLEIKVFKIVKN